MKINKTILTVTDTILFYPRMTQISTNYKKKNIHISEVYIDKKSLSVAVQSAPAIKSIRVFFVPFVDRRNFRGSLLAFQRNWKLAKQLTFYHLVLALLPLFFLLPVINILLQYVPTSLFSKLNIVLGFIFIIIAFKKPVASTQ